MAKTCKQNTWRGVVRDVCVRCTNGSRSSTDKLLIQSLSIARETFDEMDALSEKQQSAAALELVRRELVDESLSQTHYYMYSLTSSVSHACDSGTRPRLVPLPTP